MFRHRGKSRTLIHNLRLASLLSFVAGMVNVSGLLALHRLTTNVTGHFAFFAEELTLRGLRPAWPYLLFILAFLFGAFCSNLLVEFFSRVNVRWINTIPVATESAILLTVALLQPEVTETHTNVVACLLLFAMGLQNALVTSISNSVVRTTHLTGLFTDLGIELSQIFFFRKPDQQKWLRSSIRLRITIICCFFLGGITGGFGYQWQGARILLIAVATLLIALVYDTVRVRLVAMKRRYLN
jgi:uncharacterized membrane protein YoaK (UPF0700 family)